MKIPNMQLFLDRFISVNRVRYKDYPSVIAILNTLTLDNVIFSAVRNSFDEFGELVRTVDMYVPKVMKAMNQSWLPAYYTTPRITQMVTEEVQLETELEFLTKPGFYFYKDQYESVLGCVVVGEGVDIADAPAVIKQLVQDKNLYQIETNEITIQQNLSTVLVDSPTIYQPLKVVLPLGDVFRIPETDYGPLIV